MDVKQSLLTFLLLLFGFQLHAQSNLGLTIATSKNDNHMETVWYQHQVSQRFSAGIQLRYSDIRYRFVNARSIENGSTLFIGAVLGYNFIQTQKFRLDFNLTTSYRNLNNDENPELPTSTDGMELDPNIIFGLRISERLLFHSGALFRAAVQFGDEPINDEQLPFSAIVLNSLSIQKDKHLFSLRTYAGPMNGATGDTEKFFWQFSLGYQYQFASSSSTAIPFFNF